VAWRPPIQALDHAFPQAALIDHDLDSGTFKCNGTGEPISRGELAERVRPAVAAARDVAGAAASKLKRDGERLRERLCSAPSTRSAQRSARRERAARRRTGSLVTPEMFAMPPKPSFLPRLPEHRMTLEDCGQCTAQRK
jgi:hypothetical protein